MFYQGGLKRSFLDFTYRAFMINDISAYKSQMAVMGLDVMTYSSLETGTKLLMQTKIKIIPAN